VPGRLDLVGGQDPFAAATALAAAGRIKVPVQREVPLAEAPGVLAQNRAGGVRGKTVIRI
jgi:NADPH:quinone reductase-like Zn-dependent oxidoreductase